MPRPKGLVFVDRLAPYSNGFIFLCQRAGHKPLQKFLRGMQRDAEEQRSAHDAIYHNDLLREAGLVSDTPLFIEPLTEWWLSYQERLLARGNRSKDTIRYYRYMVGLLREAFKPRERLAQLTQARIDDVALTMAAAHEKSGGAAIVKALDALRAMLTKQGVQPRWTVPIDDIDPEPQETRELTMEQILWLLEHTPAGSVEEAAIALKMRTGIREVELADLKVQDFDAAENLINPVLRPKGRGRGGRQKRRHLYPLADDIVALLIPFTRDKDPEDFLLMTRAGGLQQSSLRRRLVAASERANAHAAELLAEGKITTEQRDRLLLDPPLRGLKPIRSEVATIVDEEAGEEQAADFIGWTDVETYRRWYKKSRRTLAKLERSRRIADILKKAAPLPRREPAAEGEVVPFPASR